MDDSALNQTLDRMRETVVSMLHATVQDLTKQSPKLKGSEEQRILFPEGINFIAIDLEFDPTRLTSR